MVTVTFKCKQVGSGLTTVAFAYSEGQLSAASQASLEAEIANVCAVLKGPHQHNGSKIVTVVTLKDGHVCEDLCAAAVLTDAEVLALEGEVLKTIAARHAVQAAKA